MAQPVARWVEVLSLFGRRAEIWPREKFSKFLCVLKWKKEKQLPQGLCGSLKPLRESVLHVTLTAYLWSTVHVLGDCDGEGRPEYMEPHAVGPAGLHTLHSNLKGTWELGRRGKQMGLACSYGTLESISSRLGIKG